MVQPVHSVYYTRQDYLRLEQQSADRHEYYQGQIYLMVSRTRDHARICANSVVALSRAVAATSCDIYGSDMRVYIKEYNFYTYTDAMLVCGETAETREDEVSNPLLIIEVLSKSTRNYDLKDKFDFYKSLPTLRYYLTIEQKKVEVICNERVEEQTWQSQKYTELSAEILLPQLNSTLAVAALYRRVNFPKTN